jgi:hexosaminidase
MRNITKLLVFLLIITGCKNNVEVVPVNIIPQPQDLQLAEGSIEWNKVSVIDAPDEFRQVAETFVEELSAMKAHSPVLSKGGGDGKNAIRIEYAKNLPKEGYELDISPEIISIRASAPNGCYYAFQTLKQLIPFDSEKRNIALPALKIKDQPRFRYSGMHIDVSRHFFTVD